MIHPRAEALRDLLTGRLIAATLTPRSAAGLDPSVISAYFDGLIADGVEGLAVTAHTGRGPFLSAAERDVVISVARRCGVPLVVGVNGDSDQAAAQAARAAELGADGVLVFAPSGDIVAHHEAIWRTAGLPMIAFDLYLRPYPQAELAELVRHPGVAGLKVARLHDAIACQAGVATAREAGRLAITGEDRMFGASLMWGAQAALVGLAAAAVHTTAATLRAWREQRYADFVAASAHTDALAEATFTEPMDGYVQRMQWIAVSEGRLPASHAVDPHAPDLPEDEQRRVIKAALA